MPFVDLNHSTCRSGNSRTVRTQMLEYEWFNKSYSQLEKENGKKIILVGNCQRREVCHLEQLKRSRALVKQILCFNETYKRVKRRKILNHQPLQHHSMKTFPLWAHGSKHPECQLQFIQVYHLPKKKLI